MKTKKLYPCFRCEKRYAEMEDAELCERRHAANDAKQVRSAHVLERCTVHHDRPAVHELGSHMPQGDGSSGFTVSRRLCADCYADWKRHNIAFEYIG